MVLVEHSSEDVQQEVIETSLGLWHEITAEHMDLLVCSQVVALATTLKRYGAWASNGKILLVMYSTEI